MEKNLPAMQETWIRSLGQEDPLENRKETHSSIFLPGEFFGQKRLAGYSPWDHKELDTTEWLSHSPIRKGIVLSAWFPVIILKDFKRYLAHINRYLVTKWVNEQRNITHIIIYFDIPHKYKYIYLKITVQNHRMNENRPIKKVKDSEIFVVLSEW